MTSALHLVLRQGPLLAWDSSSRVGDLDSNFQRFTYLCLFSPGITSVPSQLGCVCARMHARVRAHMYLSQLVCVCTHTHVCLSVHLCVLGITLRSSGLPGKHLLPWAISPALTALWIVLTYFLSDFKISLTSKFSFIHSRLSLRCWLISSIFMQSKYYWLVSAQPSFKPLLVFNFVPFTLTGFCHS